MTLCLEGLNRYMENRGKKDRKEKEIRRFSDWMFGASDTYWCSLDWGLSSLITVYQCFWIHFLFRQPSCFKNVDTHSYTQICMIKHQTFYSVTLKPLFFITDPILISGRKKGTKLRKTVQWKRSAVWTVSFNWPGSRR